MQMHTHTHTHTSVYIHMVMHEHTLTHTHTHTPCSADRPGTKGGCYSPEALCQTKVDRIDEDENLQMPPGAVDSGGLWQGPRGTGELFGNPADSYKPGPSTPDACWDTRPAQCSGQVLDGAFTLKLRFNEVNKPSCVGHRRIGS
ncbi:unnamed protein product [Arctogadus glacialis]